VQDADQFALTFHAHWKDLVEGSEHLRNGIVDNQDQAEKNALSAFRLDNMDHQGSREEREQFLAIQTWFTSVVRMSKEQVRMCTESLALKTLARWRFSDDDRKALGAALQVHLGVERAFVEIQAKALDGQSALGVRRAGSGIAVLEDGDLVRRAPLPRRSIVRRGGVRRLEGLNSVTWVVATNSIFGAAYVVGDTKVTWRDRPERTLDVQKVQVVGNYVIAAFAGSVLCGFAAIEVLRHELSKLEAGTAWELPIIANTWLPRVLKRTFALQAESARSARLSLLLAALDPPEEMAYQAGSERMCAGWIAPSSVLR
jgi:hypothetical protein